MLATEIHPQIIKALGYSEGTPLLLRHVLVRIADLREAAGEEPNTMSPHELLVAGQHEVAALNDDGTVTVTLYTPLKSGSEVIKELVFKRPTARMLQKAQARRADGRERDGVEKSLRIFAELTGRAPAELEELDLADMEGCNLAFSFLSKPPRRTGTKS